MAYQPLTATDFAQAFPGSHKVSVPGGQGVRVPMREIALTDGTSVVVYDTSGPHDVDVDRGVPPVRAEWIRARGDVVESGTDRNRTVLRARPGAAVTQLHYARRREVTPEMEFIAVR